MAVTSTKATAEQRAWLQHYENTTGFEAIHQEELDSGEMTFAEVAQQNIDWFEAWSSDAHLQIQRNVPGALDDLLSS
ncbi:hypothetical protein ABGT16_05275 [Pseudomonas asiatica]|uniref:hypothetical protein n=1 Tax=Pseudomonas asiatica TaxID=2219225 RepID=UPI00345DF634